MVTNLLAAPFNTLLAEQVEKQARSGNTARPAARLAWQELLLSPLAVIHKLLYLIGWAIPLLLLSFTPVINIAAPILWVLFGGPGCWRWNMRIIP